MKQAGTRTTQGSRRKMLDAVALRSGGATVQEIAMRLRVSERSVAYYLKRYKNEMELIGSEYPEPSTIQELCPSILSRIELDSTDSFEAFFNAYSGRILQPVHKEWVQQALSSDRVLVNCPPRHAKSTIFSVWFPLWQIAGSRDIQLLIISQTDTLAKKFTNEIAWHLSYNREMISGQGQHCGNPSCKKKHFFGRFRPEERDWPWRPNSGELLVFGRQRDVKSGDLTIQVRGSGQQIIGMEANWIIVDDPVSPRAARSESLREDIERWLHTEVMSRLEPGSRCFVIGQRLHINDLYGKLAKEVVAGTVTPYWKHLNYPAILDWDRHLTLWPEKWGWDEMQKVIKDVGTNVFSSMYQQNPLPESARLARDVWLFGDEEYPGCVDRERRAGEGTRKAVDPMFPSIAPPPIARVLSIDPSPTRYAGLIVADVFRHDTSQKELRQGLDYFDCTILELKREKMAVRDMLREIDRCWEWYRPDYFIFEQVAAQRWFLQDKSLDKYRRVMSIIPHTTGHNKSDPVLGFESLSMDFEFGHIRLPWADPESKAMSQLLIDEAQTWPQGETDDLLMSLWFIKNNYTRLIPRVAAMSGARRSYFNVPNRVAGGFRWKNKSTPKPKGPGVLVLHG